MNERIIQIAALAAGAYFLFKKSKGINGTEKNDLGFGFLGNGLTVWDRNQIQNGDYKTVAHISDEGLVKLYKNHNLTPSAIKKIIKESQEIIEHNKNLGL